jgi:hypothetical protein
MTTATQTTRTQSVTNKLVAKVREIATARPNTVYLHRSCEYAEGECSDGTTGCLLGQALLALGYTVRELRRIDELTVSSVDAALKKLLKTDELPINTLRWLRHVQVAQDTEVAWGEAVEAADQEVSL